MTTSRPNVLLLLADQHRPDWVGYHGDVPVRTPNLDRLAEEGVAFRNAVSPAPVCGPARSCLASGLEYDRCYVRDHHAGQDYPLAAPTLYGRLRDRGGYHTVGTGKFDLQKYSGEWGVDGQRHLAANGFSDGFNTCGNHTPDTVEDPYTAYLDERGLLAAYVEEQSDRNDWTYDYQEGVDAGSTFPSPLPPEAYHDNFIGRRSIDCLESAPADRPWFMQVNFVNPHNPWNVTEEMHGWYRDPDVAFPPPLDPDDRFDAETHQAVRRNYAAMVQNVDRWVGEFLDELERRGERENTVVVYSADHGESLGDRGSWYKRSPYTESVGVPLVVSGGPVASRGVVDVPATLLDVHATALDYAEVDEPCVQSVSMRPYLDGETDTPPRDAVISGLGPWRLAFDGRYKFVRGFDPDRDHNAQVSDFDAYDESAVVRRMTDLPPLLFDTEEDPDERRNLAPERPDLVADLDATLESMRT